MRDSIENQPIRFYLEHRPYIEKWAALRDDADRLALELLQEMSNELPVPEGARVHRDNTQTYEAVVLYREGWLGEDGLPRLGVGVGWGTRPDIGSPQENGGGPWWGIWRGERNKDPEFMGLLRTALRDTTMALGLKVTTWGWMPIWNVVPPAAEGWYDKLPTWSRTVHDLVHQAWDVLADPLEGFLCG